MLGPVPTSATVIGLLRWGETMTTLLLLAGSPTMAYRTLRTAAATGAKVFVLAEPRAKPLGASRYCSGLTVTSQRFDALDAEPAIAEINRLVADRGVDMVIPGGPKTSRFLADARSRLAAPAFPGPDPATFELLNDKSRFTELVERLGFACPTTHLLPNRDAVADAIARR